jgi:hypothetical protein
MEAPYIHKYGFPGQMGYEYLDPDGIQHWWSENHLKYNWDWSWIMPVVEKIEKGNFGIKQCRKVVEIYHDDTKEVILKVKEKSRMESIYSAIIQFIKWYNQQQS